VGHAEKVPWKRAPWPTGGAALLPEVPPAGCVLAQIAGLLHDLRRGEKTTPGQRGGGRTLVASFSFKRKKEDGSSRRSATMKPLPNRRDWIALSGKR